MRVKEWQTTNKERRQRPPKRTSPTALAVRDGHNFLVRSVVEDGLIIAHLATVGLSSKPVLNKSTRFLVLRFLERLTAQEDIRPWFSVLFRVASCIRSVNTEKLTHDT